MNQKHLEISAGKIGYFESSGRGRPVIIIHGNSQPGSILERQIESALGRKFRLLAPDLPGHGTSFRAESSEQYNLPNYADWIHEFWQALGQTEPPVLLGYSLGGHVVLEVAAAVWAADLPGFGIWGTPPLAFPPDMDNAFLPNPNLRFGFSANLSDDDCRQWVRSFFAPGNPVPEEELVACIRATDPKAREGLGTSIRPGGYADEVALVAGFSRPLLVLHGAQESLVNLAYLEKLSLPSLWRGKVQLIPNSAHAPHWEQPDAFNAIVGDFLRSLG